MKTGSRPKSRRRSTPSVTLWGFSPSIPLERLTMATRSPRRRGGGLTRRAMGHPSFGAIVANKGPRRQAAA